MPDIQTEMQKILQAWEQPEVTEQPPKDTAMFTPTTNTSRATFEMVRDNPGSTHTDYVRRLETLGHKRSSTASLLGQMVRQGHIWKGSDGGLFPNQAEYRPLKSAKTYVKKVKQAKAKKAKTYNVITSTKPSKEAMGLAAEAMGGIGITSLIDTPVRGKVETILDDISLSDAHELYRKLHQYFGGLPK